MAITAWIGKGLQQRDLLVSKGLDLRAADVDHPDGSPFAQQRRCKHGSNTATACDCSCPEISLTPPARSWNVYCPAL